MQDPDHESLNQDHSCSTCVSLNICKGAGSNLSCKFWTFSYKDIYPEVLIKSKMCWMTGSQTEFSLLPVPRRWCLTNPLLFVDVWLTPGLPQCADDSVSSFFNLSGKILHMQCTETGIAQVETIGRAFRNMSNSTTLAVNSTMGCGYPLVCSSACPAHLWSWVCSLVPQNKQNPRLNTPLVIVKASTFVNMN